MVTLVLLPFINLAAENKYCSYNNFDKTGSIPVFLCHNFYKGGFRLSLLFLQKLLPFEIYSY
jgi:hypothetical protein